MLWFDKWYEEVKESYSPNGKGKSEHWKTFIPRITHKNLKRTIKALLGIVQYVQMNHPNIQIIPKTMCQDDVENYFSLQRARVAGGKPTSLQFFESSASLTKEMLISSEMKDITDTIGSYDQVSLPNIAAIPLCKNNSSNKSFTEKEGWAKLDTCMLDSKNIIPWDYKDEFYDAAEKLQLTRHVIQTTEYLDLYSPTTLLHTSQPILTALHANKSNQPHVNSLICTAP
jgi:hypothetical protein